MHDLERRQAQGDRMSDGEGGDNFQHGNGRDAKTGTGLPGARLPPQHRGQQQREQKEDMVHASPNMKDAQPDEVEKPLGKSQIPEIELLGRRIGTKNGRDGFLPGLQTHQTAMARISIEK